MCIPSSLLHISRVERERCHLRCQHRHGLPSTVTFRSKGLLWRRAAPILSSSSIQHFQLVQSCTALVNVNITSLLRVRTRPPPLPSVISPNPTTTGLGCQTWRTGGGFRIELLNAYIVSPLEMQSFPVRLILTRLYQGNKLKVKADEKRGQTQESKTLAPSNRSNDTTNRPSEVKAVERQSQPKTVRQNNRQLSIEINQAKDTRHTTPSPKSSKVSPTQISGPTESVNAPEHQIDRSLYGNQEAQNFQRHHEYSGPNAVVPAPPDQMYTYSSQHAPMFWTPANLPVHISGATKIISPPIQPVLRHGEHFTSPNSQHVAYFPPQTLHESVHQQSVNHDPVGSSAMVQQMPFAHMTDMNPNQYEYNHYQVFCIYPLSFH